MPDLAEQLRAAIRASGRTQYELAKASGVPRSRVCEFMGGRNLGLDHAGKLAAALGIRLTKRRLGSQEKRPRGE